MNQYIDEYLFYRYFNLFKQFVEKKSNSKFVSFASNPYLKKEEGYKVEVNIEANKRLNVLQWNPAQIGNGIILKRVISAIELKNNNFVRWQSRHGESKRPHHIFFTNDKSTIIDLEKNLYNLYREDEVDEKIFNQLLGIIGQKYSLLAYLFFLKDKSQFLPIGTKTFDTSLSKLGVDLKTSRHCSWNNYKAFNTIIRQLKDFLYQELNSEVSLLDAHSFAWIISRQMEGDDSIASKSVKNYSHLSHKDKEAIIKARIGQGQFRDALIEMWGGGSVTNCKMNEMLIASHIKPWRECDLREAVDPFNGLLLVPNIDKLFDKGFISFNNDGNILISNRLDRHDAEVLNISDSLSIRGLANEHKKYLEYHRDKVYMYF